jgi:methionine-rich copper-binding protein CopC
MGKARLCIGKVTPPGFGLKGILLCVFLAMPACAFAHASLVKSVPSERAVLVRAPAKIQLWFSERLEARFSSFSLFDANSKSVELGAVAIDRDDPKSLAAEIKTLPAGRYVVKYRVLSVDGHVTEKEFAFTISP